MTNKIISKITDKINSYQLLAPKDRIVVGVSGGSDSTALMLILSELEIDLELHIIYIDHGLRPDETPTEISFVKGQAKLLNAQFYCAHVDVKSLSQSQKISTEEAARNLRYEEFRKLKKEVNAKYIAVGHNSDDQVEEFLIRLIRGSGRKGLAGMEYKNGVIIRPLLSCSKQELRDYLKEKKIFHCEDSSNIERVYLRNQVRLDLIPELEKYNPAIKKNILNSIEIIGTEEEYLENLTGKAIDKCTTTDSPDNIEEVKISIKLREFRAEHLSMQRRIIEATCWKMNCKPSFTHIERLIDFAANGENGKTLHLNKGLRVVKHDSFMKFHRPHGKTSTRENAKRAEINYQIPNPGSYFIKELNRTLKIEMTNALPTEQEGLLIVSANNIRFPLCLRYHRDGERFQPVGVTGSKKVSKFLTDKKIHGDDKILYPIICQKRSYEDEIIAIAGLTIADKFRHKIDNSKQPIYIISLVEQEQPFQKALSFP